MYLDVYNIKHYKWFNYALLSNYFNWQRNILKTQTWEINSDIQRKKFFCWFKLKVSSVMKHLQGEQRNWQILAGMLKIQPWQTVRECHILGDNTFKCMKFLPSVNQRHWANEIHFERFPFYCANHTGSNWSLPINISY